MVSYSDAPPPIVFPVILINPAFAAIPMNVHPEAFGPYTVLILARVLLLIVLKFVLFVVTSIPLNVTPGVDIVDAYTGPFRLMDPPPILLLLMINPPLVAELTEIGV